MKPAWLALALSLPVAAQPYDAHTTYAKLAGDYPFIAVASADTTAPVQVHKDLEYARRGQLALALDLYLPGPGATPPPLVVLVHGGGWRSGSRTNLAPLAARLAARGYAAATVSYRLSPEARYPAAIEDVKEAVRWLQSQAAPRFGFDASRTAIAGGSAGGQIASLAGMTSGGRIHAVVNIDGLSDFTSEEALRHEDDPAKNPSAAGAWFGGRYADKRALWHDASPISHVGRGSPPVLFIGSGVPRFSAGREAMAARLQAHGILAETVLLPGTPHAFWLFDPWLAPTADAMSAFLARVFGALPPRPAWSPDLGNGRYRNPVLHADYSDPDVIRVGNTYYMTSSSFANAPGLPLLKSADMVNWELVGHALARPIDEPGLAVPQHGGGVWAPCLRYHDGKFWIFYPDPDRGVYVITATDFAGPWSAPKLLLPGKGIIDPTPLWDDDGQAWLLHAWAKSRAGVNNRLTLRRMAPDASRLLDDTGTVVVDGDRIAGYRTLEGPKLYKENRWYYIFAPAGGVEHGWQSVFRSRRIEGPYESRIVMEQAATSVNGPHQGAWVRTPEGSDWFFHFQDKGPYGRVVHLQPMRWIDGWPLIGEPSAKPGVGQPVLEHAKPVAGRFTLRVPATGDEFDSGALGPQWQWAGNADSRWFSLDENPGHLRLFAQPQAPVRRLSSVLTQKYPAPVFRVDARMALHAMREGDQAGLGSMGAASDWFGIRLAGGAHHMVQVRCDKDGRCAETLGAALPASSAYLRLQVTQGARVAFSYSTDGIHYTQFGQPFQAVAGRWVGAQIGLFATGAPGAFAEFDYLRIAP